MLRLIKISIVIGMVFFTHGQLVANANPLNQVIYDNSGTLSASIPSDLRGQSEAADDFSIPAGFLITDFHWWGNYAGNPPPVSDDFSIRIFPDANGVPAQDPMAVFHVGNVDRTPVIGSLQEYSTSVNPFGISPNTVLWLSIVNNTPVGFPVSWGWSRLDMRGNDRYRFQGGPWLVSDNYELAFQITGQPIPEPTTMLLLGSGLIGLAGYGRKKFFRK